MPFAIILVILAIASYFVGATSAAFLKFLGVSPVAIFTFGVILICWSIFGRTDSDWS